LTEEAVERGSPDLVRLMTRLTRADPTWVVWKSIDRAVSGAGDIDAVASRSARPALTAAVVDWARAERLGPTIVCRHLPGTQVDVVCAGPALVQIDLHDRAAGVADAETLVGATELDDRGFRVVRPGARALLLLLSAGGRRGDALLDDDRREIESLVALDPGGAEALASKLGPLGRLLPHVLDEVGRGRAGVRSGLELELFRLSFALRHPTQRLAWARYRLRPRRCPVVAALALGRRTPVDASRWLESVRMTHAVHGEL
jgi:hypothetical protein